MPAARRPRPRRAWVRRWRWSASTGRKSARCRATRRWRPRQGASGPRGRRLRRADRPRLGPCRDPLSHAQRQQGRRRARAADPGGPQALQGRDPRLDRRRRTASTMVEGEAGALQARGPARHRADARRRARAGRAGGGPRDRDLPRRQAPFRHERRAGGRIGERAATALAGAAARARPAARPAQDRDAAAPRRPHRSTGPRSSASLRTTTAGRCRR